MEKGCLITGLDLYRYHDRLSVGQFLQKLMDSLCTKLNQLVSYGTFYFDSHLKEHLMEEMGLGEEAADRILNVSVAFSSN